MIVGSEERDGRAGLGESVGVDERSDGKQVERPLNYLERHLSASVGQSSHAEQRFSAAGIEYLDDASEHGRHDHRVGDTLAFDGVDPGVGIELR